MAFFVGRKPPIYRPVQFTLIPSEAHNYEDVVCALHWTDHICTLLSYQEELIRNIPFLKVHAMLMPYIVYCDSGFYGAASVYTGYKSAVFCKISFFLPGHSTPAPSAAPIVG